MGEDNKSDGPTKEFVPGKGFTTAGEHSLCVDG
jgi:hypothetical protein